MSSSKLFGARKMCEVGTRRERGMIKTVIETESGEEASPGETGSVIRTDSGGREEAGPGRAEDRTRDIIPGIEYIIIGLDVSKNISLGREYVIKYASLGKESVEEDKTDEGIKILDIEDAQETVIRDPSGEGEAGADPELVTGAGKTEL
jgi:hypothetical protein